MDFGRFGKYIYGTKHIKMMILHSLLIHVACTRGADIGELKEIFDVHGSAKQWCFYLHISDSTCNQADYSRQHPSDVIIDVAKAYLDQKLACWEEIIYTLCKKLKKNNAAKELSKKHDVDYASLCG